MAKKYTVIFVLWVILINMHISTPLVVSVYTNVLFISSNES